MRPVREWNRKVPGVPVSAAIFLLCVLGACVGPEVKQEQDAASSVPKEKELSAFDYRLAEKFWEQGQADLAVRYLDRAVRKDPKNPVPRLRILDVYLSDGNADAALTYLKECPSEMRDTCAFQAREALALDLSGRSVEAGRILKGLAAGPAGSETFITACAENRVLQGRKEEALEILDKGLQHHPRSGVLLRAMADLNGDLERYGEEAECRMKVIDAGAGNRGDLRRAVEAFLRAGRVREGIERISAVAKEERVCPAEADAALACLRSRLGEYGAARALLERAFQNGAWEPTREERMLLAELRLRTGAYEEGALLLKEELRRRPQDAVVRAALAWALHRSGRPVESRRILAQGSAEGAENELLRFMKKRLERSEHATVPE